MIFGAILTVFKWIALGIIALIPKFPDLSVALNVSISPLFDTLHKACAFVDLSLFSTCLTIIFVLSNIELVYNMVMWIVRKIPGVS